MEKGISIFDWEKPEIIPPYQFEQNPDNINSKSAKTITDLPINIQTQSALKRGKRKTKKRQLEIFHLNMSHFFACNIGEIEFDRPVTTSYQIWNFGVT